jgi:hypothetical protein
VSSERSGGFPTGLDGGEREGISDLGLILERRLMVRGCHFQNKRQIFDGKISEKKFVPTGKEKK